MVKLQKPEFVYMNGGLRSWNDAVLHIGCEAVTRGLSVFEGLKGYWGRDGCFRIVELRRHYERLQRSARLLHIPFDTSYDAYEGAIFQLAAALLGTERDMWFRTTLYVTEGHWGEGTAADLVVTAYHTEKEIPESIDIGVSTWRRSVDLALPARIKASTNYQVARLARIEGRPRGWSDMVLLNQEGRVAEATGACVLMVRDGTIYTPPATEGALESITLDLVESLASSLGVGFVRRPIDRTELLIADELALCGTLAEITLVRSVDGFTLPSNRITGAIQSKYFAIMRAEEAFGGVVLSAVHSTAATVREPISVSGSRG